MRVTLPCSSEWRIKLKAAFARCCKEELLPALKVPQVVGDSLRRIIFHLRH